MIDVIANLEILIGILFLLYSSYLLIDVCLLPAADRHPYVLLGNIYAAGMGGLFGFSGMVLKLQKWYSILIQILLLAQCYLFVMQLLDLL